MVDPPPDTMPRSFSSRWSQRLPPSGAHRCSPPASAPPPLGGGGASVVQAGTAWGGAATIAWRRCGASCGEEGRP
eukprot:3031399-Alexandrium_andersonii.AAC.1